MSQNQAPPAEPPIKSVFSTETVATVGFGATKRRVKQQVYVYAEEGPDGSVVCQTLSAQYIPMGPKRTLNKENLFKHFTPAPDIYLARMLPALASLEKTVEQAEKMREDGALFSAEFEFKNVLRVDEGHIRAAFGLGLTYLDQGEKNGALVVFQRLSRLEGTAAPEYKHLFNEFGIKLRKNGMITQALGHYGKALRLSPDDPHLYYNLARALFEAGRRGGVARMLDKAMQLAPEFPEARQFREYLREKALEPVSDLAFEPVTDKTAPGTRGAP